MADLATAAAPKHLVMPNGAVHYVPDERAADGLLSDVTRPITDLDLNGFLTVARTRLVSLPDAFAQGQVSCVICVDGWVGRTQVEAGVGLTFIDAAAALAGLRQMVAGLEEALGIEAEGDEVGGAAAGAGAGAGSGPGAGGAGA